MEKVYSVYVVALLAIVLVGQYCVINASDPNDPSRCEETALTKLKEKITASIKDKPFAQRDLDNFFSNQGATSAIRFLNQRSCDYNSAVAIAKEVFKWRLEMNLDAMDASKFPCDLFKKGLIFEGGQKTREGGPVIWIRLGAIGNIIHRLERARPNAAVMAGATAAFRGISFKNPLKGGTAGVKLAFRDTGSKKKPTHESPTGYKSMEDNKTIKHIMRAICWWLDNWIVQNPNSQATLVLDFENIDKAFLSASFTDFHTNLDVNFPNLFDRVIRYRHGQKLRHLLRRPVEFGNRVTSTLLSSAETDTKLKSLLYEVEIDSYIRRVDDNGFSLLPQHVSGKCAEPDERLAPPNCQKSTEDNSELYDRDVWLAVVEEFSRICKPRQPKE